MRFLVIGGSRYFGKRLVHLLIDEGADVTVLNRGQTPDEFGNAVTRLKADRADEKALREATANQSWDVIFDQVCFTPQEAQSACDVFQKKTKRYVMTSTASIYENQTGECHEKDFDPRALPLAGALLKAQHSYAEGKKKAEAVFAQQAPFSVAQVRLPIVLGLDDYTGRLEFHINRIRNGEEIYLPNPQAKTSFVNSTDAARFLHFMGHANFEGPINCASPDTLVLKTLMEYIEKRVQKKAVYAAKPSNENHSPFGITSDQCLNVHLAQSLGFTANPLSKWIPELVTALVSKNQ